MSEIEILRDRFGYKIGPPAGDKAFLRRVTTLCNGIPKDALPYWAAKSVAEFAIEHRERWEGLPKTDALKLLKGVPWSERDDKGDRGTAVHKTLEAIVRGKPIPDDLETEDELGCAIAGEEFLKSEPWKPLGTEVTVFSRRYQYAGTFDLLAKDSGGITWLLDFKTSRSIYPNMAAQLVAYHNAEWAVAKKKPLGSEDEERWMGRLIKWGPGRAERLGLVHVRPDGADLYPIREAMHERLWKDFLAARRVKLFLLDCDPGYGRTPREPVYEEPTISIRTEEEAVA